MHRHFKLPAVLLAILAIHALPAFAGEIMSWKVDGVERQAIVIAPSKQATGKVPLLFVFHGHGGTMKSMERNGFQRLWPEAVVVCPQGLPTVTPRDPQGERSGWQTNVGKNNDRDLKFVDAMITTLREKFHVDETRIFATGHSNGGGFTYLLGVARADQFRGIAPSAAGARGLRNAGDAKRIPVLHVAGEADNTVPFENQKGTMEAVIALNSCEPKGKPWAKSGKLVGTIYTSKTGTPFVSVIHPGNHKYPAEAPELIVRFFKEVSAVEKGSIPATTSK